MSMIRKEIVEEYREKLESKKYDGKDSIPVIKDDLEQFVNLYDLYKERDRELREIQTTMMSQGLITRLKLHMDVYNQITPSNRNDEQAICEIVTSIMEDMNVLLHDDYLPNGQKCLLMDAYVKARDFCNELERAEELENSEEMEEDYIR